MVRLSVTLFGAFQAHIDDVAIDTFHSFKAKALLAYLILERKHVQPRDSLAALLWPDMPNHRARGNLRSTLAHLRNAIHDRRANPAFLLINRDTIQFNAQSDYWLDVQEFVDGFLDGEAGRVDNEALGGHLSRINRLYTGDLLAGFACQDAPLFEEWLAFERQRYRMGALASLRLCGKVYLLQGEYGRAQGCGRRWVYMAPCDEAAHRLLMRALALGGHRGAALKQYGTLCQALAAEYGVEPHSATASLYGQILEGDDLDLGRASTE